jgi:pyruvate dehydrogenase E2 component (dihydrolipoamide acetyltransferase)
MPDVVMPRLSESMQEGTLLQWLVADGAEVAVGDELALVETDKATMSCEAEAGGVLRVLAGEGDTVPVGSRIATIGEDRLAGGPAPAAPAGPAAAAAPAAGSDAGGRRKVSPVARRLARERGVDLSSVEGSGPGGRIVKADVPSAPTSAPVPAAPAPAAPAAPAGRAPDAAPGAGGARGEVRVEELSRTSG